MDSLRVHRLSQVYPTTQKACWEGRASQLQRKVSDLTGGPVSVCLKHLSYTFSGPPHIPVSGALGD